MWRFLVTQPCLVYEGSPLLFFYAHTCRLWWVTCRLLAVRVVPRIIPRICCPWIRGWLVLFVHGCGGKSCKHQHKTLRALDTALLCTLCGVRSVVIFGDWNVPPAVGLILQLLCSHIGDRNIRKKTKQNITTERTPHSVERGPFCMDWKQVLYYENESFIIGEPRPASTKEGILYVPRVRWW